MSSAHLAVPSTLLTGHIPGHPWPLGVASVNDQQDSNRIVPDLPRDQNAWLLLASQIGEVPLHSEEGEVSLPEGQARLLNAHRHGLHLRRGSGSRWTLLSFAFVGFDELVASLQQQSKPLAMPSDGWACRQLSALAENPSPLERMRPTKAMQLVGGVLANLTEHNCQRHPDRAHSAPLRNALDFMRNNIDNGIMVSHVAEAIRVSPEHLARLFRKHLGTTPASVLTDIRMRRACELLRAGDMPIADIATMLGYESHSAFGRKFRESTGLSPSHYRDSDSVPLW